jgi:hypothetical protein
LDLSTRKNGGQCELPTARWRGKTEDGRISLLAKKNGRQGGCGRQLVGLKQAVWSGGFLPSRNGHWRAAWPGTAKVARRAWPISGMGRNE